MKRGKLGYCCLKCGVSVCDHYGNRILELERGREIFLRGKIPKTRSGNPKTDRLEQLDSMLYSRKFSHVDLDFVEKEIDSAIVFFETKKRIHVIEDEEVV